MNTTVEELKAVFNLLHDGSITDASALDDGLLLTIDCAYLAALVHREFTSFHIRLTGLEYFAFHPWADPDSQKISVTDVADLVSIELEILSADHNGDTVAVACKAWNSPLFKGGELFIRCKKIELNMQNGEPLSLESLVKYSKRYWDAFGGK